MNTPKGAIVVAFDGSAYSELALDWAITAAEQRNRALHIVTAIDRSPHLSLVEFNQQMQRKAAETLVNEARERAERDGAGHVTTEVADAPASHSLLRAAEGAEMMVLGARGHGAITGMWIGSVSLHVSRHASCPVVVVRQRSPKAERVVVGVDGSPESGKALGFAFDIASRQNAPLTVIRAWHSSAASALHAVRPPGGALAQETAYEERQLGEEMAGWAERYPDVKVTREAIPVHPARVLADASEYAALVVVGSRGLGAFKGLLLGSVSQSVLHHAACPVAIVR